jgi:hypothetical protein
MLLSTITQTGSADSLHQPALGLSLLLRVFHFLWKSTLLRDAHFLAEIGECVGFTRV